MKDFSIYRLGAGVNARSFFNTGLVSNNRVRLFMLALAVMLTVGVSAQNAALSPGNIVACNTTIYDRGGSGGSYANSTNEWVTIAGRPGATITISGSYALESGGSYDYIYIRDGYGNAGTALVTRTNGSGTVSYTGTAGQTLTVHLTSDASNVASGFAFTVTYSATQTCPTYFNVAGTTQSVSCGTNAVLKDNAGDNTSYGNSRSDYIVLNNNSGSSAQINIAGRYVLEACSCDYIRIYDGAGIAGTLLATYTNGSGAVNYTGTAGQTLTVRFTSDANTVAAGYALFASYSGSCVAPYQATYISQSTGSASWCAGETRTVSVTIKNTGSQSWTDGGGEDFNIGVKWNGDADYFVRVDAQNLAPNAQQTYNLTVTAPAAGANNLTFNVVREGVSWFGGTYASASQTVYAIPAAVTVSGGGSVCGSTTLTASGGSPGTIYWQNTTSGGTSTATPSSSQVIGSNGTYYFRANNGGCWGTQGSASVTINPLPGAVTVSGGGSGCGSVALTASGGSGGTIYFQGTTSNGTSTTTPSASQAVTTTGTYYFRARTAAGCWGTQGSAAVTMLNNTYGDFTCNPIDAGTLCIGQTFTDARSNASFANDYTGQASGDIYYRFTLNYPATVNIGHCGSGFDTYIHLLNSSGTSLASNDDDGPICSGNNASMQVSLGAGTYYVVSEGYGSNTGTITTTITVAAATANATDAQNIQGLNQWRGHVYDGTAFNTYLGYVTESATFDQSFGGNTACYNFTYNNGANTGSVYTEGMSIRYKMIKDFPCGAYTFTVGADDGVRLWVNGQLVINQWQDQGYTTFSSPAIYLYGETSLQLEYYENTSGNRCSFNYSSTAVPLLGSVAVTNAATCGGNGTINVTPSSGSATLWYNDDMGYYIPRGSSTKSGTAGLYSSNYNTTQSLDSWLGLTLATGSANGSMIIDNPLGLSASSFRVEFDFLIGNGSGADGMSLSYGPDVAAGGGCNGTGSGLRLVFDTYNNAGSPCQGVQGGNVGVGLFYGGFSSGQQYACNSLAVRTASWKHAVLTVNTSNQATLTIDGIGTIFSNVALPSAYSSATDKSSWKWALTASTGGANDWHAFDNLIISANEQYQYSVDGTNWQSTTSFSKPAGTYTVYMRNKGGECVSSLGSVTISNPGTPATPTTPTTQEICSNSSNSFTFTGVTAGAGGDQVDWATNSSFTGYATIASGGSFSVSVPANTVQTIWLRSRNSSTGCLSGSVTTTASVYPLPADPTVPASQSVCANTAQTITFSPVTPGSPATQYVWTTDPTFATYTATSATSFALSVNAGTTSTVYLRSVTSNGCYSNTLTRTATVNTLPAITSATATASPICASATTTVTANGVAGSGATLTWYTGAGGTGTNLGSANPLTVGPGTYYARVTGTCNTPAEASVTVGSKINVGITSATAATSPICASATTTVTANGVTGTNAVVTWYTGAGGTGTNLGTGTTKTVGPGTYYARVTGDCGIAVEASVTVGSKINVAITSATAAASPICSNATTTVTANGVAGTNAVVTWYTGAGGTGTNLGTGTTKTVGPGTYYARVTGDCGTAVEASVTVGSKVDVAITSATAAASPICASATTTVTANGVTGTNAVVTWYTGAGGTGTNLGTGTTKTVGPGTYYARVTGDCGTAVEASVTVGSKTNVGITSATAAASPICASATTTVTANGVTGTNAVVTWYTGAGGTGTNLGTGTTRTVGPGTYYARVTGDCGTAVEASVTVGSKVNVAITSVTASASPICSNATTTVTANGVLGTNAVVTWYTGAGGTGTDLGTGTTKTVGPGTYYARVTGDCGTAVEASVTVTGDSPLAGLTITPSVNPICQGAALGLTATNFSGTTYSWNGPGSYTATGQSITRNSIQESTGEGTYTVTATNSCGNISANVTINVHTAIPGIINVVYYSPYPGSPVSALCQGNNLQIRAEAASAFPNDITWSWSGPNGYTSNVQNPLIANAQPNQHSGTYDVNASNVCSNVDGYGNSITVDQSVDANPDAAGAANSGVNDLDAITIEACGSYSLTLNGNNPSPGSGNWTVGSTPGLTAQVTSWGGATTNQSVTPTVNEYGAYTFVWTVTNGTCSDDSSIRVFFTPAINVVTELAGCSFVSPDKDIIKVKASGGWNPGSQPAVNVLTVTPPAGDNLLIDISTNPQLEQVFTAPFDGISHTYKIDDQICVYTQAVTTKPDHPTDIAIAVGDGVDSTRCIDKSFDEWLTFRDNNNNAILSIDDNNQDLGEVTVKVYKDAAVPSIAGSAGSTCAGYQNTAMQRHFVITAANTFNNPVDVRLYFTEDELNSLITESQNNDIASDNCSYNDNVSSINDLYVTKYTGANEDGDYTNNAPGGLYKVYGNPTALPTQPDGPLAKSANGFNSVYSGGAAHHYVQLSVNEFSELWLHGSGSGTALPVEMLYIEANAVNNTYIQVRWATALEINNNGFQVERSTDGSNWTAIGWVDGHNNTTVQQNYSYDDYSVQPNQRYYYRLKQIDNDGQYEYTGIVSAIINLNITFDVKDFIPNPATNATTLIITSSNAQAIEVEMFDGIGQKVITQKHNLNKGSNQISFDITNLAAGTYTAVVSSANEVYGKKLIVVK